MLDVPSSVVCCGLDAVEEAEDMASQEAWEAVQRRLDEIRDTQLDTAVKVATLATKLDAMQNQQREIEKLRERATRLETELDGIKKKEFRGWIEGLVKGAVGGLLALGAQHLVH